MPLLSGFVPPLASFYQPRPETGPGLADGLRPGETTLLLPSPAGSHGTGKTQIAVGFAHAMWSARAVDLLAWVPAGSRSALTAGLAQAAADLGLHGGSTADGAELDNPAGSADAAAQRFLDWLARTGRPWAVILDDVTAADDLRGLWPRGPAGQVVVTSRLREDELAAALPEAGLTARAVPGFSRREALDYLHARLTGFADQRIEAIDLAADLDGHPLALALAAAAISATGISCREYRAVWAERLAALAGTLVDGCPPTLLAAWSIAVERAGRLTTAGQAWAALTFAAALDTDGIPAGVVTTPAACAYITGGLEAAAPENGLAGIGLAEPGPAESDAASQVRSAYATLERLGLLMVDAATTVRTVWLHPAVQAAVRAYLAPETVERVSTAAATALLEAWPAADAPDSRLTLSQALRDATAALRDFAGTRLWQPDAHPVLIRAGASLAEAPALAGSGRAYWQELTTARCQRATVYYQRGEPGEGALVLRRTLADCERYLGPAHPMTTTVRDNLQAATE